MIVQKFCGKISLLFLFLISFSAMVSAQEFLPNEVIVKLNQTSDLPAIAAQYGLSATPLEQFTNGGTIYRLRVLNNANIQQTVANLRGDLRLSYADPNYVVGTPNASTVSWSLGGSWSIGGSTKGSARQWMRKKINLDAAHVLSRGQGVKIAVLDTGIDLSHPIFAEKLVPGYDFVDGDANPSEVGTYYQGAYGHGTHVAGIIAQVAPDAKIMPLRVLDSNGVGNVWTLAKALSYAANPDGNDNTNDGADIINLSLGTTQSTSLVRDLLKAETEHNEPHFNDFPHIESPGILVVAAAGNTGNTTKIYPAAEDSFINLPGLIAVGASTSNDTLADFSTRGPWVQIVAPGERIVSAIPGGRYGVWRGTSMSAPIVSGIAALVQSKQPQMRTNFLADWLRMSAVQVPNQPYKRPDALSAVNTPQMP